jgi:KaiC/GvpD/RAD55 family RecA-like ATPase
MPNPPATPRIPRLRTYVEGLDEKMEGGIPEGNVVLLAGEAGTMKSTLAYHMVYMNALKEGRRSLYVSMEQSRDSLVQNMEGLGMPRSEVEDRLSIVDLGLLRKNLSELGTRSWGEVVKMYARTMKQSHGYEILVLDSLPVLETLATFQNPRNELFQFFEWIRDLQVTCLLITEIPTGTHDFGDHGEAYLADGIIHVMMSRVNEETMQRRIRIVKMRSSNHSTNLFSLLLDRGTFRIARVIST